MLHQNNKRIQQAYNQKQLNKVTPEFEQELVRYFGKSALILEEDFEVTEPEAIRELGLKNRFVMGKGTYSTKNGRILVKNSVR